MPSQIVLPCFMNASKASGDALPQSDQFGGDDPLDFDLLAEYLLDDGTSSGPNFDFSIESPPNEMYQQTSIVSPDLASTSVPDASMEGGIFSIPVAQPNLIAAPANSGIALPTVTAPPPLAPAPLMPGPPSSLTGIAPAPPTALPQQMIVHQHKRPRYESNVNIAHQGLQIAQGQNPQTVPSILSGNESKTGRQKSQAQIDRRRERNRILARRTRLRKKFFFESLQKDVMELQRENLALKEIVRSKIDPEKSKTILAGCTAQKNLPDAVLEHCGDPSALGSQDFNLMNSIRQSQQSFVITDPSLQDNPIVYASDDFLTLTGYSRDQVLGRNCRFLQGTDTNPAKVEKIQKAVSNGDDVSVTFLNYMADGTPFWNKLFIAALRDAQNNIVNFIGVSVKVAGPEPGDPEAVLIDQQNAADVNNNNIGTSSGTNAEHTLDADAAVMAIEGAFDKAVASAPTMTTKSLP